MEIILVEVDVKPEQVDAFKALIAYDQAHSEADEPGCLRFDVLQDTEDANKFFYYEVYRDEAARLAHRETPHFKKYATESAEMLTVVSRHILQNFAPGDGTWR